MRLITGSLRILEPKPICAVILALIALATYSSQLAQSDRSDRRGLRERTTTKLPDAVDQAIQAICEDQRRDPQATTPIDEMAAQPSLPLTDRQVMAGRQRAERLLPIVKSLLPVVLARLAEQMHSQPINRSLVISRLAKIASITPNVDERDNASVQADQPNVITFGTIFLAGLRSDEAMVAVIAHEFTHVVDGSDHSLQPLVRTVATKSAQLDGRGIQGQPAVELTCELVGLQVSQEYLRATSRNQNADVRLARALGKNCVSRDLSDETHLSPRDTLRQLLLLKSDVVEIVLARMQKNESNNIHFR